MAQYSFLQWRPIRTDPGLVGRGDRADTNGNDRSVGQNNFGVASSIVLERELKTPATGWEAAIGDPSGFLRSRGDGVCVFIFIIF